MDKQTVKAKVAEYEKAVSYTKEQPASALVEKVLTLFFGENCPMTVAPREGTKPILGVQTFGYKAGPSYLVSMLIHEMCHFIEIDRARMHLGEFGFKYPERWNGDELCLEPSTTQMTMREIRVFAMQEVLMKHLGMPSERDRVPQLARHLPDYHLLPGEWQSKERAAWILKKLDHHTKQWTFDTLKHEWNSRCKVMEVVQRRTTRQVLAA